MFKLKMNSFFFFYMILNVFIILLNAHFCTMQKTTNLLINTRHSPL